MTDEVVVDESMPDGGVTMKPNGGVASRPRVLVVDDDPRIRQTLASLLEDNKIDVITAANGQEGLDTVRDTSPDLVLCDVIMPRVNGFEFCRRLRADLETRLTPVVLITGLRAQDDRVQGIEAGADDFLSKPFDEVELLARVRSLLRVKSYTDELERAEAALFTMARALEERDRPTQGHCERLSSFGSALGQRLGLPDLQVNALRRAGVVHDIGKISLPDRILLKDRPLTPDERAVMELHPITGEQICQSLKSFRLVLPIIRHHHEKLDGSGYPDGLSGEEIPLTARVLQIVDVYDALTSKRPYRRALSVAEALQTLAEEVERGWWDPDVFEEFRRLSSNGLPLLA